MKIERILMTGDTVGGVWTFTMDLAESLVERGIEVRLVTFGGKASEAQTAQARAISGLCLLDSAYKLEWMEEPWADVEASGRWLMEIVNEYKPDVVHLNSFAHGALPWRTATVLTAHSCVLSWWQAVKGENAPPQWKRYRNTVARSLAAVRLVTAPSTAMARAVQSFYGVLPTACRIVPNGRSAAKFYPRVKEPFVFTAGRLWDEAKNLRAVARVASNLPWPVYCAGRDTTYESASNACNGGCNMLGHLSESQIADWYGRASIYAMPARYEPFGLSILEAALSGCPLVLGDIPSLREIWAEDAIFVDPDDLTVLETSLRKLIEDPRQRCEFGRRAQKRAFSFNPSRVSRAYLSAYHDAISAFSISPTVHQCIS